MNIHTLKPMNPPRGRKEQLGQTTNLKSSIQGKFQELSDLSLKPWRSSKKLWRQGQQNLPERP